MTPTSTTHTTLNINVDDDYGDHLMTVPITVTYLTEVDQSYGADADGRRGVRREEIHLLDAAIPLQYLVKLTSAQVEYLIDRALTIIQLQRRTYVA